MSTTYKTMTVENLGDNANDADLAAFYRACQIRRSQGVWKARSSEDSTEVTSWMWNDGDWLSRVLDYVAYEPEKAMDMSVRDCDAYAHAILDGDYDRAEEEVG